jgi:outer membrane protein assembly factor BamB
MDKNTGEVFWSDNSPGKNILHGQWSSPAVATIGGVDQVLFGGGDGWLYSFKADKGKDGKPELLWKFDANPKDAILELGPGGTRNDIISTPVVYDNKVYFCTGQDPEHGEGDGILWCLDPTKRGDISETLAVNRADPKTPIPVKRIQAVVEAEGDMAVPNPNAGVVWKYAAHDANNDGTLILRSSSTARSAPSSSERHPVHYRLQRHCHCPCPDGKVSWPRYARGLVGSGLIVGDKIYIGDRMVHLDLQPLDGPEEGDERDHTQTARSTSPDQRPQTDPDRWDVVNMGNAAIARRSLQWVLFIAMTAFAIAPPEAEATTGE